MGSKRHNLLFESGVKTRKRPIACQNCREVKLKCIPLRWGEGCERCSQKELRCDGPEHTPQRQRKKQLKQSLKPSGRRREQLRQEGMSGSSLERHDFDTLVQNELQQAEAMPLSRFQDLHLSESQRTHSINSDMYYRPQSLASEKCGNLSTNEVCDGQGGAYTVNPSQSEYRVGDHNHRVYPQHIAENLQASFSEPARVWQDENCYNNLSNDRSRHHPSAECITDYDHHTFHSTQTYPYPSVVYP